jgi:hypothetical protein
MSRSIHENRRDAERERRYLRSDSLERLERIRERRAEKRSMKARARADRRGAAPPPPHPVDPASILIEVEDAGPFVHYPASPDDVRDVLRRLPPDALAGLRQIRFALGSKRQREWIHAGSPGVILANDPEYDPWTGRPGSELLPGLWSPPVLGTWFSGGTITLYAYVYDPDREHRELIETRLLVRMLATLVHEVGHHEDASFRSARGRWRMSDRDKTERYAEEREFRWLHDTVLTSIVERHGSRLHRLLDWVEEHAGARMDLRDLAGDPRTVSASGRVLVSSIFSLEGVVWSLIGNVEEGRSDVETRLLFAEEIHWSEHYDTALRIVEGVLAERPDEVDALALKGDILEHVDRLEEATAVLERALALDPEHERALDDLVHVHFRTRSWNSVVSVSDRRIALAEEPGELVWWVGTWRARALIELGRFAEAERRIAEASEGWRPPHAVAQAVALRALSAYRQGCPERAVEIADEHRKEETYADEIVRLIRRAALRTLGRAEETEPLTYHDRELLTNEGLEDLAVP